MSEEIQNENALATQAPSNLATTGTTIRNGGYFEYKVIKVSDLMDGGPNVDKIEEVLNLYGEMGWRLSQTIVNEISALPYNNIETGAMSSVQEETLLIFERWIQL